MTQHARAVLWDMDGTLVDSFDYHWRSWREALAAEGYGLTYKEFKASFGQRNDTILRGLLGPDLSDDEIERIGGFKEERYRSMVRAEGIDLLPGITPWITRLNTQGWRQAIASSAPRQNIETILQVLQMAWCFDTLVAAEDVQCGKPDPQVFLLAAKRVAVPPTCCIVVEDAPAGVEGARRAGMRSIGVRSSHGELPADLVVQTLAELPDDAFEALLVNRANSVGNA